MGDFGYIYIATNIKNGMQYIGQTKNFKLRIRGHLKNKTNNYFENALKKYGIENFKIIKFEFPTERLSWAESFWIEKLDTLNGGYNLTTGGDGGYKRSKESIKKMRMSKIGQYDGEKNPFYKKKHSNETKELMSKNHWDCSGKNNYFYGKHHTEETKEKIRNKLIGKPMSEQAREKMKIARVGRKPNLGKKFSDEWRENLRESWRRKRRNNNEEILVP